MNNLIIRVATDDDIEKISGIFTEELEHHINMLPERFQFADRIFTSAWYHNLIKNPEKLLFVADLGGNLVGLLLLKLKRSPDDPILKPRVFARVEELAVSERFRRQGIGQRLMDHALEWAIQREADEIELAVWEGNPGAIALYQKLGFEADRRKMRIIL